MLFFTSPVSMLGAHASSHAIGNWNSSLIGKRSERHPDHCSTRSETCFCATLSVTIWTGIGSNTLQGDSWTTTQPWITNFIKVFFFIISQNVAICPKTSWQSLLMACRKYIQWQVSYFKRNHRWLGMVVSRSHATTHHKLVGLLWTSDQLVAKDLYLTTHNTHNKRPWSRWDSNPQSQFASGRRPTP